jgi:hypothetical protein
MQHTCGGKAEFFGKASIPEHFHPVTESSTSSHQMKTANFFKNRIVNLQFDHSTGFLRYINVYFKFDQQGRNSVTKTAFTFTQLSIMDLAKVYYGPPSIF